MLWSSTKRVGSAPTRDLHSTRERGQGQWLWATSSNSLSADPPRAEKEAKPQAAGNTLSKAIQMTGRLSPTATQRGRAPRCFILHQLSYPGAGLQAPLEASSRGKALPFMAAEMDARREMIYLETQAKVLFFPNILWCYTRCCVFPKWIFEWEVKQCQII